MSVQLLKDLEKWYLKKDPWNYESSAEDNKRREILLSEIPQKLYKNVLDIGCGHGFITRKLPGEHIIGVDISKGAIKQAKNIKKDNNQRINYLEGSIFGLLKIFDQNNKFDLIVVTGVLYPQYISNSLNLIYLIIDKLLAPSGILVSVHIDEWYEASFPYFLIKEQYYSYLHYSHRLNIYQK